MFAKAWTWMKVNRRLLESMWLGAISLFAVYAIYVYNNNRSIDQDNFNANSRETCLRQQRYTEKTGKLLGLAQAHMGVNVFTAYDLKHYADGIPENCG